MQTQKRRVGTGVIARLRDEPYRFEFFQAVRVLNLYFQKLGLDGEKSVGERVRFRNSLKLSFPVSELESIEFREFNGERSAGEVSSEALQSEILDSVELTLTFFGLTGISGALPNSYTERLNERETYFRDRAARAFLDLFSNRSAALFFRAWEKYRLAYQYERDRRNRFLPLILSLIGIDPNEMRDLLIDASKGVFDESLGFYAGILSHPARPAHAVERLLADYFQVPIRLNQFVGNWFSLNRDQATSLGLANASLGKQAICGLRVWQRQGRVKLEIGPLSRQVFETFLPGGNAGSTLQKWLPQITGPELDYEICLILRAEEIIGSRLDSKRPGHTVRLGRDTWMISRPCGTDRNDARYEISLSTLH